MEPLWSPWLQPVAITGKTLRAGNRRNKRKPLRRVATGCLRSSMVRRGSTVRVRQRALQKPRKSLGFRPDLDRRRGKGRRGVRHHRRGMARPSRCRAGKTWPHAPTERASAEASRLPVRAAPAGRGRRPRPALPATPPHRRRHPRGAAICRTTRANARPLIQRRRRLARRLPSLRAADGCARRRCDRRRRRARWHPPLPRMDSRRGRDARVAPPAD
jgi:hypothetical protein